MEKIIERKIKNLAEEFTNLEGKNFNFKVRSFKNKKFKNLEFFINEEYYTIEYHIKNEVCYVNILFGWNEDLSGIED